jgi:hypothetical protein
MAAKHLRDSRATHKSARKTGADDRIRTGDPHLGKVMLYQLSHVRLLKGILPAKGVGAHQNRG